jgi:uncharacterized protein (TIGR02265 family)
MEPKRGQVRGGTLLGRLRVLERRGGPTLVSNVLERLEPDERNTLQGLVLPVSWYSAELALHLDRAIVEVLSPSDRRLAYLALGRQSAEENLHQSHRAFVQPGDPHFLLGKAPQIFRFYYAVGRRTYERLGERKGVVRTFEAESVSEEDCLTICGWHQRAIEISGGEGAKVEEVRCRTHGSDHCEYVCSWERTVPHEVPFFE